MLVCKHLELTLEQVKLFNACQSMNQNPHPPVHVTPVEEGRWERSHPPPVGSNHKQRNVILHAEKKREINYGRQTHLACR